MAAGKKGATTLVRSARTGRIVKKAEAAANPSGTVVETIDAHVKTIRRLRRLLKQAYVSVPSSNERLLRGIEKELGI
jgi:hypothetical protein